MSNIAGSARTRSGDDALVTAGDTGRASGVDAWQQLGRFTRAQSSALRVAARQQRIALPQGASGASGSAAVDNTANIALSTTAPNEDIAANVGSPGRGCQREAPPC